MQKIFLSVIDMSIVSSLVILAVLLVRAMLKKAPRRFAYVLWAAVLLRLLCPFAVESPLSLIPERAGEIAQSAALPEAENVTFVSAASAAYRAIGDTANGGEDLIRVEVAPERAAVQGGVPEIERQYVSASHGQVWLLLCAWLWPAGTAAVLVWGIAGQIRLRRMLVGAVKLEGEVWLADHIPTAFVMGLVRPKIYLPSGLEGAGRDYVLAHERAHVRRGDHITRLLAFAALALHWFNPLVWLAFAMSGRDMEMSCDEAVMRRSGGDIRADYCQTLLDMSANKHFPSPCLLAFGEGDTGARIRNALRWKKPAFWAVCGAAVLIVAAGVLLLTNPLAKKDGGAAPDGDGQTVKVSFPGHYVDVNRAGKIWDPGPFAASMKLPEGWSVRSGWSEVPEGYNGKGYAPVYFRRDEDDVFVGQITYFAFDPDNPAQVVSAGDGSEAENRRIGFCTELYIQGFWQDFESVAYSDTAETFRASKLYTTYTDKTEIDTRFCIGRYDTELGVYVAIELKNGVNVSESDAALIAESLELEPVSISSDFAYFGFGGYDYSDGIRRGRGPFTVDMQLPEGWSSWFALDGGDPPDAENLPDTHALLNPGYIYDENGKCAAFVAWAGFDPNAYPDDTTDRGLSTAVNAALKERTDWAKYAWYQLDFSADSGIVYVSQIIDSDGVDTGRRGICVYNRPMEAIVVVEFADGREYDWAARLIAGNIRQLDMPGIYSGSREQELVVPGYYSEDGALAECRAFRAELTLPAGWSLGGTETQDHMNTSGLRPLAYMYDSAGNYAGSIGWQELGRDVETQGIRVESEELGAFVCVQPEPGAASEEDLDKIAQSITLRPGRVQYVPRFAGVDWGTDGSTLTEDFADETLSTSWCFLGRDCEALYRFGTDGLLNGGKYSFNNEDGLSREEAIALYKQLLEELEAMYGESHTAALLDYRTPMDIQSVIDGKSDTCENCWTKQSPDGDGVDIYLELHDNDLTVNYSLLYEG